MTHFLLTDDNPQGYKLEDILSLIRKDVLFRTGKIADDKRAEARHVMENNIRILGLISESIDLAEDSSRLLQKSFGPSQTGKARIGSM
jgi:hypothetical protein